MYLAISNTLSSIAMNISRLARDMWNSTNLNDVWERELRNWDDII
jgi:hypothetical protein